MKKTLALFAMGALTLLSALASAETYAVIIGINDYPEPLDRNGNPLKDEDGNLVSDDLFGCVNDAKFYRDTLVKHFGVKESNIRLILDSQATEANFIAAVKWLLQNAKAGDKVFFSYSGHGTQAKFDDQPGEQDDLTEAICLVDTLVTDDFFSELAKMLQDAGANSTYVFDSCHSGGMSRDIDQEGRIERRKYVPFANLSAKQKSNHFTMKERGDLKSAVRMPRAVNKGSYAFLFAGKEDQPTSDLQFKDNSPAHGAFTYIMKLCMDIDPTASVEELVETVKQLLEKNKFKQVPNAEYSDPQRPTKPLVIGS
jgi:hypothetical protein